MRSRQGWLGLPSLTALVMLMAMCLAACGRDGSMGSGDEDIAVLDGSPNDGAADFDRPSDAAGDAVESDADEDGSADTNQDDADAAEEDATEDVPVEDTAGADTSEDGSNDLVSEDVSGEDVAGDAVNLDAADADAEDVAADLAVDAAADPLVDPTTDTDVADVTADVVPDAADAGTDPTTDPVADAADAADTADADADAPALRLPDLIVMIPEEQVYIDEANFNADSCPVVEGCIVGVEAGEVETRRLLRFTVETANIGTTDLVMGSPAGNPAFEFSPCHGHYHFNDYASYTLQTPAGEVVAQGHKQAFCLLDSGIFLDDDPTVRQFPRYSCNNQGIQRGWYDIYSSELDCQWIDVTDLPAGEYTIHVSINPEHLIRELSYENNTASLTIVIEDPELDAACPFGTANGPNRNCDWDNRGSQECTPGEFVRLGCNSVAGCALGSSTGDPMMRVCAGEDASCFASAALAANDDSCGGNGTGPYVGFTCPEEAGFTIWTAPYNVFGGYTCNIGRENGLPASTSEPCAGTPVDGPGRNCGWDVAIDTEECFEGFEYWVGCNPEYCALDDICVSGPEICGVEEVSCTGQPMMRACEGDDRCVRGLALAENQGSCGGQCPEFRFVCPDDGAFTVLTASEPGGAAYTCDFDSARIIELTPE